MRDSRRKSDIPTRRTPASKKIYEFVPILEKRCDLSFKQNGPCPRFALFCAEKGGKNCETSSNRGGGIKSVPYSKLPELLKLRISDEKFPAPLCLIVCFRAPLCPLSFERDRM